MRIPRHLFALCFAMINALSALGQHEMSESEVQIPVYQSFFAGRNTGPVGKGSTVSCGPDTVAYPHAKSSGLAALQVNGQTSASAVAQYFDAPADLSIEGFRFFAWSNSQPQVNVECALYLAGSDSLPTGNPLATVTLALDSAFGTGTLPELSREAIFPIPVMVNQPYLLVVENSSSDNVVIVASNYSAGDGEGEWLPSVKISGGWSRSHTISIGNNRLDGDFLMHPILNYEITPGFESPRCYQPGSAIVFENKSSEIQFHRMYSLKAFLGIAREQFTWDFGDGSNVGQAVDTLHVYSMGGNPYTVTLWDSMHTWTGICTSDTALTIAEGELPEAGFDTWTNGMFVDFQDTSSGNGIYSWWWDFGDGNFGSGAYPSHYYNVPGMYEVCLTVTNDCGEDEHCELIEVFPTVSAQGPEEGGFEVSPNPGEGRFRLQWQGAKGDWAHLELRGVDGRLIRSEDWNLASGAEFLLELEQFPAGSYWLLANDGTEQHRKLLVLLR